MNRFSICSWCTSKGCLDFFIGFYIPTLCKEQEIKQNEVYGIKKCTRRVQLKSDIPGHFQGTSGLRASCNGRVSVLQSAHPETVPSERQLKGHPAPGVSGGFEGEWSLSRSPCGLQENLGHVRRVCARDGRQQGQIVRLDPVGMNQIRLLNTETKTQTCIMTRDRPIYRFTDI